MLIDFLLGAPQKPEKRTLDRCLGILFEEQKHRLTLD